MQTILYELRKEVKHVTQKEVADYLGISVNTYRNKEKGSSEFTQDEMFLLSSYFNMPIHKIFLPRKHQIGNNAS